MSNCTLYRRTHVTFHLYFPMMKTWKVATIPFLFSFAQLCPVCFCFYLHSLIPSGCLSFKEKEEPFEKFKRNAFDNELILLYSFLLILRHGKTHLFHFTLTVAIHPQVYTCNFNSRDYFPLLRTRSLRFIRLCALCLVGIERKDFPFAFTAMSFRRAKILLVFPELNESNLPAELEK